MVLKASEPLRVTVIEPISTAAVAASGGCVALGFVTATDTTFELAIAAGSATLSCTRFPFESVVFVVVLTLYPTIFFAQSLTPPPVVSLSSTRIR